MHSSCYVSNKPGNQTVYCICILVQRAALQQCTGLSVVSLFSQDLAQCAYRCICKWLHSGLWKIWQSFGFQWREFLVMADGTESKSAFCESTSSSVLPVITENSQSYSLASADSATVEYCAKQWASAVLKRWVFWVTFGYCIIMPPPLGWGH